MTPKLPDRRPQILTLFCKRRRPCVHSPIGLPVQPVTFAVPPLLLLPSIMPITASRAVLRQSQLLSRRSAARYASSSSESASKGAEAASSAASKASQGLSRASSTAGPMLSNAASNAASALRNVGGRTGKVVSFVDCE